MAITEIVMDDATRLSSKLLECAMERQKVLSNNMANADTPNYIRKDVDFQSELRDAVRTGDARQLAEVKGKTFDDDAAAPGLNGNNVSVSVELNELTQNSVFFNLMSRAYNTRVNILRNAISSSF